MFLGEWIGLQSVFWFSTIPVRAFEFFFIGVSRGERPLDFQSWFAHPRTMSRCFQLLLWLNVEWRCYKKNRNENENEIVIACLLANCRYCFRIWPVSSVSHQNVNCNRKKEKRKKKERTSFVSNVRGNIFSQNVKSLKKMFCVLLWKNWLCKLVFIFVQSFK